MNCAHWSSFLLRIFHATRHSIDNNVAYYVACVHARVCVCVSLPITPQYGVKFIVSSSSSSSLIILSWSRKAIIVFTASFQSEFVSPYIDYRSVRSVPQAFLMYQTQWVQTSLILFLQYLEWRHLSLRTLHGVLSGLKTYLFWKYLL